LRNKGCDAVAKCRRRSRLAVGGRNLPRDRVGTGFSGRVLRGSLSVMPMLARVETKSNPEKGRIE
jgi:hypothetical protein